MNRSDLLEQLGGECVKCRTNIGLQIDHIVPLRNSDKGFRTKDLRHPNLDNLQILCYPCHVLKTNRDKQEFS